MKNDGTITIEGRENITIKGKDIQIEGSGKIEEKAGKNMILKAKQILCRLGKVQSQLQCFVWTE